MIHLMRGRYRMGVRGSGGRCMPSGSGGGITDLPCRRRAPPSQPCVDLRFAFRYEQRHGQPQWLRADGYRLEPSPRTLASVAKLSRKKSEFCDRFLRQAQDRSARPVGNITEGTFRRELEGLEGYGVDVVLIGFPHGPPLGIKSVTLNWSDLPLSALVQPNTVPYARWCGRGGIARCPPIPIDGLAPVRPTRHKQAKLPPRHKPSPRFLPKPHSMPPLSRMTPEMC